MAFKELESKAGKYADVKTWNKKGELKQGDVLDGYLFDFCSFTTKYGEMKIYIIKTKDGELHKITGQKNIMSKLQDIKDFGVRIRIEFKGIVETANGAMKDYKIEIDEEDRIDVNA